MLASPAVAVAFCPRLFALRPPVPGDVAAPAPRPAQQPGSPLAGGEQAGGAPPPLVQLPYRMVFAVATAESVFLYDTQVPRRIILELCPTCAVHQLLPNARSEDGFEDGFVQQWAALPGPAVDTRGHRWCHRAWRRWAWWARCTWT